MCLPTAGRDRSCTSRSYGKGFIQKTSLSGFLQIMKSLPRKLIQMKTSNNKAEIRRIEFEWIGERTKLDYDIDLTRNRTLIIIQILQPTQIPIIYPWSANLWVPNAEMLLLSKLWLVCLLYCCTHGQDVRLHFSLSCHSERIFQTWRQSSTNCTPNLKSLYP